MPTPSITDMLLKRAEYQAVAKHEARTSYLAKQKRICEGGNKTGKLLAWLERKERERMAVRDVKKNWRHSAW